MTHQDYIAKRDEALLALAGFVRQWINEEIVGKEHRSVTSEDIVSFMRINEKAIDSLVLEVIGEDYPEDNRSPHDKGITVQEEDFRGYANELRQAQRKVVNGE